MELIDSAAQRYQFTELIEPVNVRHGMLAWQRMEQQVDRPWALLDNCQHAARQAYYGKPDSPAVTSFAVGACCLALLLIGNRD